MRLLLDEAGVVLAASFNVVLHSKGVVDKTTIYVPGCVGSLTVDLSLWSDMKVVWLLDRLLMSLAAHISWCRCCLVTAIDNFA